MPPVHDRRFWNTQALVLAVVVSHAIIHLEVGGYACVLIGIAYVFPVLYAALEFGLWGSVATTGLVVVATLPYVVFDALTHSRVDFAGHVLELVVLAVVAPVVGRVVEAERQTRRAHEAAELRYRALFETSGLPTIVLDETGRIQEANPAASDVLRGPLEGRLLEELLGTETTRALLAEQKPVPFQVSEGLELRPVVSRPEAGEGERLTQVIFQDVTEELSEHRRARAWGLAVLSAQEEERRRISQDLHDEALQLVVELRRRIERAARLVPQGRQELLEARSLADEVIDELRLVALRLRPPDLDDLGLVASLDRLVAESRRRGLSATLDIDGKEESLRPAVALALYRVGQEALTNAEHHARASSIALSVSFKQDALELVIEDDGVGFDPERAEADASSPVHLGLVGMRERMQLVGGRLEVRSSPGEGTTVRATALRW